MSLTPKQESFCQKYIELGNAAEAYRQAYDAKNMKPESCQREARKLLDNPKITPRVEELKREVKERFEFTIDKAVEEYEEARKLALTTSNPSAAVAATTGKARLFGLDQMKVTGDTKVIIKDMTGSGDS